MVGLWDNKDYNDNWLCSTNDEIEPSLLDCELVVELFPTQNLCILCFRKNESIKLGENGPSHITMTYQGAQHHRTKEGNHSFAPIPVYKNLLGHIAKASKMILASASSNLAHIHLVAAHLTSKVIMDFGSIKSGRQCFWTINFVTFWFPLTIQAPFAAIRKKQLNALHIIIAYQQLMGQIWSLQHLNAITSDRRIHQRALSSSPKVVQVPSRPQKVNLWTFHRRLIWKHPPGTRSLSKQAITKSTSSPDLL